MAGTTQDVERGNWNSKLGFILAAAGSAIGLGNIWKFPNEVASHGGAAFILVYVICCFAIGFPVMVAEITIGRRTKRNPVGAFLALAKNNKIFGLVGAWGVICGAFILAFYFVVAGWTFSFVFEEIFFFFGASDVAGFFATLDHGLKNAIFTTIFALVSIVIVTGGISGGIERATKTMMPILFGILLIMVVYVQFLDGSTQGLRAYLIPDLSKITTDVIFAALGQSFFSLSLGMGALITYGSYLSKHQDIPEAGMWVTIADLSIAFLAGLLIIPAMYVAQNLGVQIFDADGNLLSSVGLVFNVLPELFHSMSDTLGLIFGVGFFGLLTIAALTSTISLLEVPVSFSIDEWSIPRKKSAWLIGGSIWALGMLISFDISLIDFFSVIFNDIGLPLGGLLICLFLGYYWGVDSALTEMENGNPNVKQSIFAKLWPIFIKYICPILIGAVFVSAVIKLF